MGPTTLDLTLILSGALMIILGCVLYIILQTWKDLRDFYPAFPYMPPFLISLGIASATNGLIVGYLMQMATWVGVSLTVIMCISFVWCAIVAVKAIKMIYDNNKASIA